MGEDREGSADGKRHDSSLHNEGSSKKRKLDESAIGTQTGMSQPLSKIRKTELPEFNLISERRNSHGSGSPTSRDRKDEEEWQTVQGTRPQKKAKKIPKQDSSNYPSIEFSDKSRHLNGPIKISDLQNLVLYILAEGPSPQFVAVRHRPEIRKTVVLMVPGLEMTTFFPEKGLTTDSKADRNNGRFSSPDQYYPKKLRYQELPDEVQQFADMFPQIWPVRTPGDDRFSKMHSPLHAMLTAPTPKTKDEKKGSRTGGRNGGVQPVKEPENWKNTRTPIPEYVHTSDDLLENEYVLHPAVYSEEAEKIALAEHRKSAGVSKQHGWVDTLVENFEDGTAPENEIESGSLTAGRQVLAMDCEMCMTGEQEFSLTRISIVSWDGSVLLDELVKPDKPIINYLTQYSGITEKMLDPVTTTLSDIQKKLLDILTPRTILIGHSLNSDLTALKMTHPFIIDTALLYPHPRGPPLKSSLKWLAQRYLNREIQKGHGTTGPGAGHDSIEDARTCLDLVKQKCEKGKSWGAGDSQGENLFKRVARTGVKYKAQGGSAIPSPMSGKSSAAVDWGDPKKGPGGGATFAIGAKSDDDVVEGVIRAVKGDHDGKEIPGGGADFVWGRLRELEALKGWWNNNKLNNAGAVATATSSEKTSTAEAVKQEAEVGEGEAKDEEFAIIAAQNSETAADASAESKEENKIDATVKAPASITSNALPPPVNLDPTTPLTIATSSLTKRIFKIYEALPPCTAFIVYSGSGDPREMSRLQALHMQYKRDIKIKRWDDCSVKWTDDEEQALRRAAGEARNGIGFVVVK